MKKEICQTTITVDIGGNGFSKKNGNSEETYFYEFNVQGDIIGIIDSTGNRVVEYTYGAWGDILSITGTLYQL